MENKYLQVRKENIFTKFVNFIKGLFGKKVEQYNSEPEQATQKNELKSNFIDEIRINKEENKELLDLQNKYENNEISLGIMSDEEIQQLHLLYKRQVLDLKKKVDDKKTQLAIIKHRIKSYSSNM